jgi:5'-phosphate synthase pdxT subunit
MHMSKVGVLALQGAFIEHTKMLRRLGAEAAEVRLPEDLSDVDGLIIPGGESTSIGKLAMAYGLVGPIKQMIGEGRPVWGTCAGLILLATEVEGRQQPFIGVMDVVVHRNAFGRQIDSCEADIDVPALDVVSERSEKGQPFHAVFIRAPLIASVGQGVQVLARLSEGDIVAVRQDMVLATAFHPELTGDTRFHRYFLRMIDEGQRESQAA